MLLQGIYLLLERLKFPAYRRLFRRVQLLHAEANPAKAAQLPLGGCSLVLHKGVRSHIVSAAQLLVEAD